tara:strand:+ start:1702 stop:2295 length:594 start_codon:yes stop_codon:yes gene_type:complete
MDKKLMISIGVLVVLLGFYFYDNSKQNSYQAGYSDIFTFDSSKISKVIILKDSEGIEIENIDSTWNINGHDSLTIKQRSIDTLFDKILKVKRSIMAVSDNPKDLSIYSLDDDECTNIVFLDEDGNTLSKATFGIWASNYYSNYYRHPDALGVYKTDSNILTYITTNPMYWGEKPKAETIDSEELPAIDIPADSLNSL